LAHRLPNTRLTEASLAATRRRKTLGDAMMMWILMLFTGLAAFALMWAFVFACDRL
jgi:hypothetical protein